jgi:hypothetical protein
VDYAISVPCKVYHHSQRIVVSVAVQPLVDGVSIRQLTCTFKEYASCKPVNGWFSGRSRSHGKILHYIRTSQPTMQQLEIPIPDTLDEIQYDTHSDAVRVRHKLKFVLSIENPDGHLSELRAVLPIIIRAKPNGVLPAYDHALEDSFPYDPALMVALVRGGQQHHEQPTGIRRFARNRMSLPASLGGERPPVLSRLPTYDELLCHS